MRSRALGSLVYHVMSDLTPCIIIDKGSFYLVKLYNDGYNKVALISIALLHIDLINVVYLTACAFIRS